MFNQFSTNWDYYLGDTFQFWNGATPPTGHVKYNSVMNRLSKIYQSYNIIKEIIDYYKNALISDPFTWYIKREKKTDTETSINDTDELLLQAWWDWQLQLNFLSNANSISALDDVLLSMFINSDDQQIGTGYLRLYQPKRLLATQKEPYKTYVLHSPAPASVYTKADNDGFIEYATYSCSNGVEDYRILDSGLTQITDFSGNIKVVDLGGNLPIFQIKGVGLISESLKQTQNSINKNLTLKGENLNYAGFLERVILNAQMPGKWIPDSSSPSGERFVPNDALTYGANTVNFIQGLPIGDPSSPDGYTNPSISYRNPVGCEAFRDSLDIDIQVAYMESGLGHLLTVGDGSLSGVSRESVKNVFETRIHGYKQAIEYMLSSVFTCMGYLLDRGSLDVVVELQPFLGKNPPEYSQSLINQYNNGLISRYSVMAALGVKNPDEEIALIEEEQDAKMENEEAFSAQFGNDNETVDNTEEEESNAARDDTMDGANT